VLCVIDKPDLDRLVRDHRVDARTLYELRYLDPARYRLSTVLSADPSHDMFTAVLVTNR
jgi:hypothetical protein